MRIALPSTISVAAVADRPAGAAVVKLDGATMGTTWTVKLAAPAGFDKAAARGAIAARLATIVAEMSQWEPDSLLSRFNRAPAGTAMVLPPDFSAVIAVALNVAQQTDGALDPTLGEIVELHGFGARHATGPADDEAIAHALVRAGWRRLGWDAANKVLRQPGGLTLDLSGIAKGHAADAVADLLGTLGIRHCLVEVGGELVGRGIRPDGDPWWVELEAPPGIALAPLRIALHGCAVATSGNYRRGDHSIDPRTGRGVANGVVSASVIADTACRADAWATALTVLGAERAMAVAASAGLSARVVTSTVRVAHEHLSPTLGAMLTD